MARWILLTNLILVFCYLTDTANLGAVRSRRDASELINNVEKETNQVDTFLTRLTSALAERVRDKLDKHHDLSDTEVKLLRFFVTHLKKGKNTQQQQKRESKKEILTEDIELQNLLQKTTDLPVSTKPTGPMTESKNNGTNQSENAPKKSENTTKTYAIKKPSSRETESKELSKSKSFDEFIINLSTVLAKRVKDKLANDHALTQNEVQLLEFFVRQIRNKKSLSNREKEEHDSEAQSNYEENSVDKPDVSETTTKKPEISNKSFLSNIDQEINNLIQELSEDNKHTSDTYHPNEIAIDPTDLTPENYRQKVSYSGASKKQNVDNGNADSKQDKRVAKTEEDSTKNKILNDLESTLGKSRDSKSDIENVDSKMMDVVQNYVESMKKIKSDVDSKADNTENQILNDVLSFVTKKKKATIEPKEVISPEKALKIRQFAQNFWKELGVDTQADELTNRLENLVKKAVHCVDRPVKDCRKVCIHGDPSNCQHVCVNSTELDCINI